MRSISVNTDEDVAHAEHPVGTLAHIWIVNGSVHAERGIFQRGSVNWYHTSWPRVYVPLDRVERVEVIEGVERVELPVSDMFDVGQLAYIEVEGHDKGDVVYFLSPLAWHSTDGTGAQFEMHRITRVTPLVAARPELVLPSLSTSRA